MSLLPRSSIRRDLRACTIDGVLYAVMVGLGETYFPLFLLTLGFGEVWSGLIATVPLAAGSLLQLVVPTAVYRLHSNKAWVLICAALQTLSFVPLIVGAMLEAIPLWAVFPLAAVYWAAALGAAPAWNPWVGSLVPARLRAAYFGRRARLCQSGTVIGLGIAGLLLYLAPQDSPWGVEVFGVMFILAACCRALSLLAISTQSEPDPSLAKAPRLTWPQKVQKLFRGDEGKLLLYMASITTAVQIAGPYFTPFMARQLDFRWSQITAMLAAAYLAKIIAPPFWAKVARRWGVGPLLWIGGLGILPMSLPWVFFPESFAVLMVFQVIGGVLWSAYELATFLALYETIAPRDRTSMLTLFNVLNSFSMALGSVLGGLFLASTGSAFDGYIILFGVSFLGRALATPLLARVRVAPIPIPDIQATTISVRPNAGTFSRPILTTFEEDSHQSGDAGSRGGPEGPAPDAELLPSSTASTDGEHRS